MFAFSSVEIIEPKLFVRRMEKIIEESLNEDSFGFRKNRGNSLAILVLILILEEHVRVKNLRLTSKRIG